MQAKYPKTNVKIRWAVLLDEKLFISDCFVQPKKPKRQSDNKGEGIRALSRRFSSLSTEELVAFLQMKNVLVSMFNRGENALARAKVQQISTVWQERHKV